MSTVNATEPSDYPHRHGTFNRCGSAIDAERALAAGSARFSSGTRNAFPEPEAETRPGIPVAGVAGSYGV
jgi:hypothetical protein